jgi:hypothetical protein
VSASNGLCISTLNKPQGFGRADHSIAVEKLKVKFSDYESIDFKNEGY